jgi:hypothetical protein
VDTGMLYHSATKDLFGFGLPYTTPELRDEDEIGSPNKPADVLSNKSVEKER